MDNFAKQAFEDALEKQADDEFQAWMKFSDRDFMVAHNKVIEQAGEAETLAEYAHSLMMMAFHIGYKARREEER